MTSVMQPVVSTIAPFLSHAAALTAKVPFEYLLIGHCISVALWTKTNGAPLVSYLLGFFYAFGGGIMTWILFQDAGAAPNPAFDDNRIAVVWTLVWYAVNYAPQFVVSKVAGALPVTAAGKVCVQILRANLLVNRVNAAVRHYPGILAAPIVMGVAASSGGKLFLDFSGLGRKGSHELTNPGPTILTALMGTLSYWATVHQLRIFSGVEGLGLVIVLFALPPLIGDLMGTEPQVTAPLAAVFKLLSNPPWNGTTTTRPSGRRSRATSTPKASSTPPASKSRSRSRRR